MKRRSARGKPKSSTGTNSSPFGIPLPPPEKKKKILAPPVIAVEEQSVKNENSSETLPSIIRRVHSQENDYMEDDDGHLIYNTHDIIDKYSVLGFLGRGAFSKVVKVRDTDTMEFCALKILRNMDWCKSQGKQEVEMLQKLRELDPKGEQNWSKMLDSFEFRGHIIIALELTGCSLQDFLRDNSYQPFTFQQCKEITYQIVKTVKVLHDNCIAHTDLKTENICLVSSGYTYGIRFARNKAYRNLKNTAIQVVDFGCAEYCVGEQGDKFIQTRYNRAPEVVFDMGWNESADIWSIGCIMFELYHGTLLFPADEDDHLLHIWQDVLGPLPLEYQSSSEHRKMLAEEHHDRKKMKDLQTYMKADNDRNRELFDLLRNFLQYNASERMSLSQALGHGYFSSICED